MMKGNERRGIRGKAGTIFVGTCIVYLLVSMFVAPRSYAQCTSSTLTFTTPVGFPPMAGGARFVDKTLSMLTMTVLGGGCTVGVPSAPAFCGRVAPNVVRAGVNVTYLPTPVACNFVCNTTIGGPGGCNVTLDNSDGLPIELMEFSVGSDDPEDEEPKATDEDPSD